jgi:hypothetical protein
MCDKLVTKAEVETNIRSATDGPTGKAELLKQIEEITAIVEQAN